MDILIALVVATFVIAGAYVGYQYSQDPANFEAHAIDHVTPLTTVTEPKASAASVIPSQHAQAL